jgi:transcriptional regulator with XRE-family HTH domain
VSPRKGVALSGEFGRFIDNKRRGRASGGGDVMLKDIAAEMGISASYLSDIMKSRRSMPDKHGLDAIAGLLRLDEGEIEEMLDTVGRERAEAAPDLPEYIMDESIPHVRAALRKAKSKQLGDDFWKRISDEIDGES